LVLWGLGSYNVSHLNFLKVNLLFLKWISRTYQTLLKIYVKQQPMNLQISNQSWSHSW